MSKTLLVISILITVVTTGCGGGFSGPGIMQTDPNDPAGSASIGTGSVTSNSTIPEEAKAAGIGLGP
jgi:hypothetical protein